MDPLDKAFTVWLSPSNGTSRPKDIHRRVDLIAAPYRYYACAVLGWSGSTSKRIRVGDEAQELLMQKSTAFERDLRHYADRVKG